MTKHVDVRIGAIEIRTTRPHVDSHDLASQYHRQYGFERIHIGSQLYTFGEGRESVPVRRYPLRRATVHPFRR